jgi:hypothetical protein
MGLLAKLGMFDHDGTTGTTAVNWFNVVFVVSSW